MAHHDSHRSRHKRRGRRVFALGMAGLLLLSGGGCTRKFYRNQADKEVDEVLAEKDHYPAWKLENYHVYPDPRARFGDPNKPDRPPMPPDDPGAWSEAPNPQKPGKAGISSYEGVGYIDLLTDWDAGNRAEEAAEKEKEARDKSAATAGTPADRGTAAAYGGSRSEEPEPPGYRIKLEQSVELGLVNAREFQDRREDLYLAALPVTLQRFAFAAQSFAFGQYIRQWSGRQEPDALPNAWLLNSNLGVGKVFSTGALLLFRFANRTVIDMTAGANPKVISPSTLNIDFVQPLLQGAGEAVTLEPLTQAERNLLYEMRNFARFRKEFFVDVASGGDFARLTLDNRAASLPSLREIAGTSANVSVIPGSVPFLVRGFNPFAAPTEGYLSTLLRAGILDNERQNVVELLRTLDFFLEFQTQSDIRELQVSRVRQQLLNSESTVIQRRQELRDALDRFKLQLGLQPDVPLDLDRTPLRPQTEQLNRFDEVVTLLVQVEALADKLKPADKVDQVRAGLRKILLESDVVRSTGFVERLGKLLDEWQKKPEKDAIDRVRMLRQRRAELLTLEGRRSQERKTLSPEERRELDDTGFELAIGLYELALRSYEAKPWKTEQDRKVQFESLVDIFQLVFVRPRNERLAKVREMWPELPRACVGGVDLLKDELDPSLGAAARAALTNRLDLMNGRSQLVDAWRQIAVAANSLLGVLNIEYHLQSLTPPAAAEPLNFAGRRTRHQLVFNGELPLVRKIERNDYRATLINWQRQRRNLMAFEDTIVNTVRAEVRQLRLLAQTYAIQKEVVELAYLQVDNAFDTLKAPPAPNQSGRDDAGNQAALTQQLLEALRAKVQAQNQLLTIWVNYLSVRMALYRDLELLPLDPRGVWIDDVANCECGTQDDRPDQLPSPQQRGPEPVESRPELLPPPRPGAPGARP